MKKNKKNIYYATIIITTFVVLTGCSSSMHSIIDEGNIPDLKSYIKDGNSVNERDKAGDAPLHLAAKKGNLEIVDTLVKSGADINARTFSGSTPYTIAVFNKHDSLIRYFQEKNIRIESNYKDSNAIFDAALANNLNVIEYLIKNGTDINTSNRKNENALHMASGVGNIEAVEFLIKNGSNTTQTAVNKMQPMHYAALSKKYNVIDIFVNYGITPSTANSDAYSNNATAILYEYIANKEKINDNNFRSKEMYEIASRHYTNASKLYIEKADKVHGEINSIFLKNTGMFLLSIGASAASPGQSTMNSSGQVVTMQPVYYSSWQSSGSLDELEEYYIKLSADMLLASNHCQKLSEEL